MKKKLTIALSSVIGTIALATAIAVPVTLQQKNKNKPLIINNDSSIITKPIDMDDNSSPMKSEPVDMDELKLNDGNKMMDDNPSPMKSEPVDLSSLINKYSLTKQKAPQVNLRRFLLPFVKIWVSKLKKERLLHYIWLAMTKILVIQLTYACLKRN
ncbi:hypothetical protein [Mycoplasmopsis bovis]|uniref:hypothetical protein n=1 Tax=Mycoplasmopsis bovis TaxID=28903 RepID=UPI00244E5BDE|nr:hypothetical protein [Mycoplasmopsis bovis]